MNDFVLEETQLTKKNIKAFLQKLDALSREYNSAMTESDKNFFIRISKYIIYCKRLYILFPDNDIRKYLKNIISDAYYLILALIKREKRYIYVNERSLIENNIRMLIHTSLSENYVTFEIFKKLQNEKYGIDSNNFSLIRNEYKTACNFIHGGNLLDENLAYVFSECIKKDAIEEKERNAYYKRISDLLNIFNKSMIKLYPEQVNGCFHREKTLLKYLMGESIVEYLFSNINR